MGSAPEWTAERNRPRCRRAGHRAARILMCSGYPTQIALARCSGRSDLARSSDGQLSVRYVARCRWPIRCSFSGSSRCSFPHGERAREYSWAPVPPARGAGRPAAHVRGADTRRHGAARGHSPACSVASHRRNNPLQDLIRTPRDAAVFAVVVVVAGGLREEIQRAFLLRRFERWVGGAGVGVVVTSVAFGAGHFVQGVDAAIATGLLGAFWAVVYVRRRSVVAPIVSHAGFNLLQLAQFLVSGGRWSVNGLGRLALRDLRVHLEFSPRPVDMSARRRSPPTQSSTSIRRRSARPP